MRFLFFDLPLTLPSPARAFPGLDPGGEGFKEAAYQISEAKAASHVSEVKAARKSLAETVRIHRLTRLRKVMGIKTATRELLVLRNGCTEINDSPSPRAG